MRGLVLAAGAVLLVGTGLVSPVMADTTTTLTAPYASADHLAYCYPGQAGSCTSTAAARASKGDLSFTLSATSPAPGAGDNANAQGHADIVVDYPLGVPAGYLTFSVVVHVRSATAGFIGPTGSGSSAYSRLNIHTGDPSCNGCQANAGGDLLTTSGASSSSLPATDLTYTYTVVNQGGGNIQPGVVSTVVDIAGAAVMGQGDQGTVSSSVDAVVTGVSVTQGPPLTPIGSASAPYVGGIADAGYPASTADQGAGVPCTSVSAGVPAGMVCFALPPATVAVDISIADAVFLQQAAVFAFWTAGGASANDGGFICGGSGQARVPAGAAWVAVYLNEASLTTPECSPMPAPATTGTVTATFYA